MMINKFYLVALLLCLCALPAQAQTEEGLTQAEINAAVDDASKPQVDLSVSASGAVGTTATINAYTENINDGTSVFAWYLDDELAPRQMGVARTTFSFITIKQSHRVRVTISEGGELLAENAALVRALSVSLIWNTNTFVPAEYEGKALPSVGSRINAFALPEFGNENPENLLYTWYVDAESQVRGVAGEQGFSFNITKNASFISLIVEVSNQAQSLTARHGITIPIMRPAIVLTPSTELYTVPGIKTYIRALPFHFHIATMNELSFMWRFAGAEVRGVPPDPNLLTLSIPEDSGGGNSYLTIEITNRSLPAEIARAETRVTILR